MPEQASDLLQKARQSLIQARQRLQTPTPPALRECSDLIRDTLQIVKEANAVMPAGTEAQEALREMANCVRREVSEVQSLLLSSFSFFAGWARMHNGEFTGYRPEGPRLEVVPGQRLRLEG